MIKNESIVLKCSCCGYPFAIVVNGVLVIKSRHHGEQHTNTISLVDLVKLLEPTPHVDESVSVV
jgi:hypothetical protein